MTSDYFDNPWLLYFTFLVYVNVFLWSSELHDFPYKCTLTPFVLYSKPDGYAKLSLKNDLRWLKISTYSQCISWNSDETVKSLLFSKDKNCRKTRNMRKSVKIIAYVRAYLQMRHLQAELLFPKKKTCSIWRKTNKRNDFTPFLLNNTKHETSPQWVQSFGSSTLIRSFVVSKTGKCPRKEGKARHLSFVRLLKSKEILV